VLHIYIYIYLYIYIYNISRLRVNIRTVGLGSLKGKLTSVCTRCSALPYTDWFGNTEEDLRTVTGLNSCFKSIIPSNAITINTPKSYNVSKDLRFWRNSTVCHQPVPIMEPVYMHVNKLELNMAHDESVWTLLIAINLADKLRFQQQTLLLFHKKQPCVLHVFPQPPVWACNKQWPQFVIHATNQLHGT